MHKAAIIILVSCILAIAGCSSNEKQYTSGEPDKHTIDTDSVSLPYMSLKGSEGEIRGEYIVEYTTSGKLSSSSQIEGKVVDASNGEPLPSANIWLVDTDYATVTYSNGEFFLILIPPGTYRVQASMMGYKKLTVENIVVKKAKVCIINFKLELDALE